MSEPTTKICSACGAEITNDAAEGLCVACLLQQAAIESEAGTTTQAKNDSSPTLESVAAAFEQLEILEKIGRGGMGTVFKARQPKLDRFVALKILSADLADKPTFADRFAREGKLLARLNHPNIVAVYDFGHVENDDGGFYFLLMEYVDGVNLRQAMREERFTPEQAIAIVPKICDALQYAHDEGVLHRDIKPENILLDVKGRVKIADFGIGKLTNTQIRAGSVSDRLSPEIPEAKNITQTGQVLGTPSYMAPEQREDPNHVDHRADIYSLGVVFYELLTGELPQGRFPLPSEKTPVDADIDAIVLKALNKEREKRQQSAGELKTEIETVTAGFHVRNKEEFPFFHDFLDFVEQKYAKNRVGLTLAIITCFIWCLGAIIFQIPLFTFPAIVCTVGVGGSLIVQYILFKVRKNRSQSTEKQKTEIESTAQTARPDEARNFALGPWVALSISLITIAILFCSAYYATEVYVPKWIQEGKVDFLGDRIGRLAYRVERGDDGYFYSEKIPDTPETSQQKKEFYRHWHDMFHKKKELEEQNLARWKSENGVRVTVRLCAIPLLTALVLGICGWYVFHRLKKRNTRGMVPLVFTFMLFLYFVPLSLQYVGCVLWSGDPGYWDDSNGDVMAPMYLATALIVLPILITFLRRVISATGTSVGRKLPVARSGLALGLASASLVVAIVAFTFIGIAGITHTKKYHYNDEGQALCKREYFDLQKEFVAEFTEQFEKRNDETSRERSGSDLFNQLSWFAGDWWYDHDLDVWPRDFRKDEFFSILVAFFFLSFVFAVPPGTVGTFLGIGYMKRNRPAVGEPWRRAAVASIAVIPLTALVLLFVGVIAWCALPDVHNDIGGICVIVAMVYLLLFAAILGFIVFLNQNQKENTTPPEPPPLPSEPKVVLTPESQLVRKRRNYGIWGCGLLGIWIIVFFVTAAFWLTPRSVSVVRDVVKVNGKIVDMTPEEARRPSTLSFAGGFGLLFLTVALLVLITSLGWKQLRIVRASEDKTGWLPGMIAALAFPVFMMWFVPWITLYCLFSAPFIGTEYRFIAETFGGVTGTFLGFAAIFCTVRATYRRIFPKPPSLARLAYRGVILVVLGGVLITFGCFLHDGAYAFTRFQKDRRLAVEKDFDEKIEMREAEIYRTSQEIEGENDEFRRRAAHSYLAHSKNALIQLQEQKTATSERMIREHHAYEIGLLICFLAAWGIGGILVLVALICVWIHLFRIRKTPEKPGMIPAMLIAMPIPIVLLWAIPAACLPIPFAVVRWGPYGTTAFLVQQITVSVMFMIGAVLGCLLVYKALRLFFKWYFTPVP